MKSKYLIYSMFTLLFLSFSLANVFASDFEISLIEPTPANNSILNASNEFTIAFSSTANPVNVTITIEDSDGNPVTYDLLNVNTPYSANFTLLLGDYYYWVSADNDGTTNMTEIRKVTTNAYELIVEDFVYDGNAIDNSSYVNNMTYGSKYIKAYTNLVSDYNVSIFNSSGSIVANFHDSGIFDFIVNIEDAGLTDGQYSYHVFANYSDTRNITSQTRVFSVDTVIPEIENISLSQSLPFSMNNDESKNISLNGSFKELPVNLTILAWNSNGSRVISGIIVDENTSLVDIIIPSGLTAAEYNLSANVRDYAGNLMSYNLGSFTVNQVPEPPANIPSNDGGGSGGSPPPVVESENVVLVSSNLTNISEEDISEISENDTGNKTAVQNASQKSFFNAITGAVTGAFQNRSFALILVVLAILVLAWIFSGFLIPEEGRKRKIKEEKSENDN